MFSEPGRKREERETAHVVKRSGGTCCFSPSRNHSEPEPPLSPCHPERSGGICSAPCGSLKSFLGSDPDEPSRNHSNLSHPSPLVIPNEVEGSAVRPAALSNPSWEATRMNHPFRIKRHPLKVWRSQLISDRRTRISYFAMQATVRYAAQIRQPRESRHPLLFGLTVPERDGLE
jgi:hypothetical protein